jgi:nitroreductase
MMLEAARLASHWGNVQSLGAVVIHKESAPKEVIEALGAIVVGWQIQVAPVVIIWYIDTAMVDEQSDRLRELLDAGALGFGTKEERREGLEKTLLPIFDGILENMKQPGMGEIDCGQGIAQATLMAYELGLGTCCLGSPFGERMLKAVGCPESCRFLLLQTVGYPAEHWEAGGQRPRQAFGRLFKMNTYDNEYPRSDEVVEELKTDKMFTRPAPLPEREEELAYLQRAFDLEPPGLL